ncbi:MAG: Cation diffusion facilitator family transporter [Pedosphaera sp.]|nr:Cation diffusion facilitator family transporter [Pedosphaera sp.]
MNRLRRSLRATLLGMVANTFLAAGKLAAGILGQSHALVADAVESFADVFSSIVVWRGLVVASEPADEDHPYGHGKAEPIAAAIVAIMLLLAAAGIAVKSVQAMLAEQKVGPRAFTLVVLVGVIVIKELLFRFVAREASSVQSIAVHADAWHHRADAITSIAAAVGISISLIGGKGYEAADNVAAIVAAGIIAFNGWRLLRPALNELMDASPNRDVIEKIRKTARTIAGVANVEKCMVRKMGHRYFVDMHVEVDPQMTVQEGHGIAHAVKDKVREQFPAVRDVLVHIEPARGEGGP